MVSGNLVALLLSEAVGVVALGFAVYLQFFVVPQHARLGLVDDEFLDSAQNVAIALWVLGGLTVVLPLLMKGVGKARRRRRMRRMRR